MLKKLHFEIGSSVLSHKLIVIVRLDRTIQNPVKRLDSPINRLCHNVIAREWNDRSNLATYC